MRDEKLVFGLTPEKKKIGMKKIAIIIGIIFLISVPMIWWLVPTDLKNSDAANDHDDSIEKLGKPIDTNHKSNNSTSISDSPVTSLLINNGTAVQYTTPKTTIETPITLEQLVRNILLQRNEALGVDCATKKIYSFYKSKGGRVIEESSYNGTNKRIILSKDVNKTFAISVNWITHELYWTDTDRKTVNVANLTSLTTKELVRYTSLDEPRGIAIHPGQSKMYWIIYDGINRTSRLEMADKNGSNPTPFLNGTIEGEAYHLSIDWKSNKLCWSIESNISCADMDTRTIETTKVGSKISLLRVSKNVYYWRTHTIGTIYYEGKNQNRTEVSTNFDFKGFRPTGLGLIETECPFHKVAADED